MSQPTLYPLNPPSKNDEEERRRLLDEETSGDLGEVSGPPKTETDSRRPRRKAVGFAIALIALLLTGTLARTILFNRRTVRNAVAYGALQSNGTHQFKPTVLIVSIDGLRADYLDRNLTPHLLALSKKGIRAKSMRPIFPTLTFPNHWALLTGLHAESHGIVANNFWDPILKEEFRYNRISSAMNPSWWLGEPMWETAEKAGIITANLMWPGPFTTKAGVSSKYFIPWKVPVSLDEKLDQILGWIDLPLETRPQLILAYEPSLDQAGHATGPYSREVNDTLVEVDSFAKNLHDTLAARNLTDLVDIIFVSDHGMTDTSHPELFYVDDVLGEEGIKSIEHLDGWPSMGIRLRPGTNESHYLQLLLDAVDQNPEKFAVYTRDTMPARYHFSHHERISPIYVVPNSGYVLTTHAEGDDGMSKGNHGYDNEDPTMQAVFVAHGPFSGKAKAQLQQRSPSRVDGWHSVSDDGFVMKPFANVEIYNLVMKLLSIQDQAASNNGTSGFWDQYL